VTLSWFIFIQVTKYVYINALIQHSKYKQLN